MRPHAMSKVKDRLREKLLEYRKPLNKSASMPSSPNLAPPAAPAFLAASSEKYSGQTDLGECSNWTLTSQRWKSGRTQEV